jgi:antitoxin HicB
LESVIEMYEDLGKELPQNLQSVDQNSPALIETIISVLFLYSFLPLRLCVFA